MYRYVATPTRVHRVVVNGAQVFRVPLCNLSDRALLRMVDDVPVGVHCPHCWVGWTEPTAAEATDHAGCAAANPEPPPGARAIPIVTPTRRLAIGALVIAAAVGGLLGVVLSPDITRADEVAAVPTPTPDDGIADLRRRVDALSVDVRALTIAVDGQPATIVVTLPTPTPFVGPVVPAATPTPPTPRGTAAPPVVIVPTTPDAPAVPPVVVVVPAATADPRPTPRPTPVVTPSPATPSPTPCFRPGVARGVGDRCRWPPDD